MTSTAPCMIAERRARLTAATAFLKRRCILVTVVDRDAAIRTYRVSGRRDPMLAEGVIAIAERYGFECANA